MLNSVYSDEEILTAAEAVSIDDIGQPCQFKAKDVRREILKGTAVNDCYGKYGITDQRESKLTGAKISAVLRASGLFQAVDIINGRVKSFCRSNTARASIIT